MISFISIQGYGLGGQEFTSMRMTTFQNLLRMIHPQLQDYYQSKYCRLILKGKILSFTITDAAMLLYGHFFIQ